MVEIRAGTCTIEWTADFRAATTILANCKGSIITTGVGKSGHIARKVSSTLASLGIASFPVHPTDAAHGDLGMVRAGDSILCFSHSGASTEVEAILAHAKWLGAPVVLITSVQCSPLASLAGVRLIYPRLEEAWGQAPTTSSTQQLVLGDMLAVAIAESRGVSPEDFARNHPGGAIGRGNHGS